MCASIAAASASASARGEAKEPYSKIATEATSGKTKKVPIRETKSPRGDSPTLGFQR